MKAHATTDQQMLASETLCSATHVGIVPIRMPTADAGPDYVGERYRDSPSAFDGMGLDVTVCEYADAARS
ncbi:MAG: hypothetical protein ACR2JI_00790 [Mycobacterium sp.]